MSYWVVWDTEELKIVTFWGGITDKPRYLSGSPYLSKDKRYKRIKMDILMTLGKMGLYEAIHY